MADPGAGPDTATDPIPDSIPDDVTPSRWQPYRTVLRSRVRSQRSHRASFVTDLIGAGLAGVIEFGELFVIFSNVRTLGGLDFGSVVLIFGLANVGFALADMIAGHLDGLSRLLRAGTLDVLYLRPQPLLAQLITSDLQLRRLVRALVGAICVVVALIVAEVDWGPRAVLALALSLGCGTAIYTSLFVAAAGVQFFLVNGAEATNAFVYGGSYASEQPASIWPRPLQVVFGFLFPVAFCAYLPALLILGLPGGGWLPAWLGWFLPVAAALAWAVAMTLWRAGVRHYQGGGG